MGESGGSGHQQAIIWLSSGDHQVDQVEQVDQAIMWIRSYVNKMNQVN
jgi:hypothetical protein